MEFSKIATLLNTTLVPNVFGGDSGVTIAEDLSNIVDLGTKLANIDGDTLKTYLKDFVVGVFDTYVDTRSYKDETYGLFLSEIEYGGALQRVKANSARQLIPIFLLLLMPAQKMLLIIRMVITMARSGM